MEVASPLTVPHAAAGTKRSLVCSPGLMDTTTRSPFATVVGMDMSDDPMHGQRAFKRRRFQADTAMENNTETTQFPAFANIAFARSKPMFSSNGEFLVEPCPISSERPRSTITDHDPMASLLPQLRW